jgi:hypothetical protein
MNVSVPQDLGDDRGNNGPEGLTRAKCIEGTKSSKRKVEGEIVAFG